MVGKSRKSDPSSRLQGCLLDAPWGAAVASPQEIESMATWQLAAFLEAPDAFMPCLDRFLATVAGSEQPVAA